MGPLSGERTAARSESLVDEYEAARRLGLSVSSIRRRRLLHQPPVWVKLGARVLYRPRDLQDLVDRSVVRLAGEPGGGHDPEEPTI
jgi:hypothetical protein